jgi:hypothetical protein
LGREKRGFRANLMQQVAHLDRVVGSSCLDEEGWALRYHLKDQLLVLDKVDGEYWRQCSCMQCTLKGDSCTAYFYAIVNGCRRKCSIPRLVMDQREVHEQ